MNDIPAWVAWVSSVSSAVIIAIVSRWYDRYVERKYGDKRRLSEAELAVKVEQAKQSGASEGYLWKRIDKLEADCETLRTENNGLQAKLSKALDDHEEESRRATTLASKVEYLERENKDLRERITALELKGQS